MTTLLTQDDFEAHVGKVFRLEGLEQPLVLDRIEAAGPPAPGVDRAPFLLIFSGPKPGPVLTGAIYETQVDTGERYTLHIASIGCDAPDRQEYQSSFN